MLNLPSAVDMREKIELVGVYRRWANTPEALQLRAPDSYGWLVKHPNNFKRVREAFHVHWITHKLTR